MGAESDPVVTRRRRKRLWFAAIALFLLGGAGLFVRYFPWVPFHPVCLSNPEERGFWGQMAWGPFIRLRGTLRDDFKEVALGSLSPRLVTYGGIYVTVDFYLDPDYYLNITHGIIGSLAHKEFNPDFYDGFGRKWLDDDKVKKVDEEIQKPRINERRDCEFTRFLAIYGAPPPKNIRQAFAETRFDHSEEFVEQGVRIMEHFVEKYRTD